MSGKSRGKCEMSGNCQGQIVSGMLLAAFWSYFCCESVCYNGWQSCQS